MRWAGQRLLAMNTATIRRIIAASAVLFLSCTAALAGAACDWNNPGHNPFTGDRQAAVMSYDAIPKWDRFVLAARVRFGAPDDLVDIGANGIVGSPRYIYGDIRGMHFGRGSRCETVDRSAWPLGYSEPAKAYRRGNMCVILPDVCGNVSWTTCDLTPRAVLMGSTQHSVPESGSIALVLAALAALWASRRRPRTR